MRKHKVPKRPAEGKYRCRNSPSRLEIFLQRAPCVVPFRQLRENLGKGCPKDEQLYFEVGVENEKGPAIVMVSCVNENEPYDVHHRFALGGDNCRADGICLVPITNGLNIKAVISNIFVRNIHEDGYDEPLVSSSSDRTSNVVRLKFEVKVKDSTVPGSWKTLNSVVSERIFDKACFDINDKDKNGQYIVPRIEITEQPFPEIRYRYISERSSAGSMPGVNSTAERKTLPEIKLWGCEGPARIELSCVTRDEPYRLHPHCLTSRNRKNCRQGGVYVVEIDEARDATVPFENLGIMSVKRDDFQESLSARQRALTYNPFEHNERSGAEIHLGNLRILCQAFVRPRGEENYSIIVPHVASEPISDIKRSNESLNIFKLSHTSGSARRRHEMIILCNKVVKEEIEIIFFEKDGEWISKVNKFGVHKQTSLFFNTPRYYRKITEPKLVFIKLKRNTEESVPVPFTFLPAADIYSTAQTSTSTTLPPPKKPKKRVAGQTAGNRQGGAPSDNLLALGERTVEMSPHQDVVVGSGVINDKGSSSDALENVVTNGQNTSEIIREMVSILPTQDAECLYSAINQLNLSYHPDPVRVVGVAVNKSSPNHHDEPTYAELQNIQYYAPMQ